MTMPRIADPDLAAARDATRSRGTVLFGAVFGVLVTVPGAVLLSGCGPGGPPRYDIVGSVTHAGQPVPAGVISFVPLGADTEARPYGFCAFRAGRYESRSGRSPGSGRYRAIIFGGDGVAYQTKIGDTVEDHPHGKSLFPTHVVEIDLPARHGSSIDFSVP